MSLTVGPFPLSSFQEEGLTSSSRHCQKDEGTVFPVFIEWSLTNPKQSQCMGLFVLFAYMFRDWINLSAARPYTSHVTGVSSLDKYLDGGGTKLFLMSLPALFFSDLG